MAHQCDVCVPVEDAEIIKILRPYGRIKDFLAYLLPVFVGNYALPGWSGHSPFYFFYCKKCGSIECAYPQGYGKILPCPKCDGNAARLDPLKTVRDHREGLKK